MICWLLPRYEQSAQFSIICANGGNIMRYSRRKILFASHQKQHEIITRDKKWGCVFFLSTRSKAQKRKRRARTQE